jgi:hypothetical protein
MWRSSMHGSWPWCSFIADINPLLQSYSYQSYHAAWNHKIFFLVFNWMLTLKLWKIKMYLLIGPISLSYTNFIMFCLSSMWSIIRTKMKHETHIITFNVDSQCQISQKSDMYIYRRNTWTDTTSWSISRIMTCSMTSLMLWKRMQKLGVSSTTHSCKYNVTWKPEETAIAR